MTTNTKQGDGAAPKRLISKAEFYYDTPLYDKIGYDEVVEELIKGDVDGYNPISGFETTFVIGAYEVGEECARQEIPV